MGATREIAANVLQSGHRNFGEPEQSDDNAAALFSKNSQRGRRDKKSAKRFCTHCHRTNHTVDQCFKLHGFPDWYEGPKDKDGKMKRSNPKIAANIISSEMAQDSPLDETNKDFGHIDQTMVQALA